MNTQALKSYSVHPKTSENEGLATLFFILGMPQIYWLMRNRRLRNQTIVKCAYFFGSRLLVASLMTATVAAAIERWVL